MIKKIISIAFIAFTASCSQNTINNSIENQNFILGGQVDFSSNKTFKTKAVSDDVIKNSAVLSLINLSTRVVEGVAVTDSNGVFNLTSGGASKFLPKENTTYILEAQKRFTSTVADPVVGRVISLRTIATFKKNAFGSLVANSILGNGSLIKLNALTTALSIFHARGFVTTAEIVGPIPATATADTISDINATIKATDIRTQNSSAESKLNSNSDPLSDLTSNTSIGGTVGG